MKIPGARLAEDVLAALPTQARLEKENRELREKLALAEKTITELRKEIKALQPKPTADPRSLKALTEFYRQATEINAPQLASAMKIEVGKARHFISSLLSAGLIKKSRAIMDKYCQRYVISETGVDLLSK